MNDFTTTINYTETERPQTTMHNSPEIETGKQEIYLYQEITTKSLLL